MGEEEETRLQQDAVTEDPVDPEERKMSVRKLAEIKMKAKQEETGGGDSEGGVGLDTAEGEGGGEGSAAGRDGAGGGAGGGAAGGVKQKPEKNLAMKQAEIL